MTDPSDLIKRAKEASPDAPICQFCGKELLRMAISVEEEAEDERAAFIACGCRGVGRELRRYELAQKRAEALLSAPRPHLTRCRSREDYEAQKEAWLSVRRSPFSSPARHRNRCRRCGKRAIKRTTWCIECRDRQRRSDTEFSRPV